MGAPADLEAAFSVLRARALLAKYGQALVERHVVAVGLKGIVVAALAERIGRPVRHMLDLDLLVAPRDLTAACAAARSLSLRECAHGDGTVTWLDDELGTSLDLHVRLFERGLFSLAPEDVLERARTRAERLADGVLAPDPRDLYAHLIGHFVRGRSNARDTKHVRDFEIVARACALEPHALAEHLERVGMRRAALYALGIAAMAGDETPSAVLAAIPRRTVDSALVGAASAMLRRFGGNHPLGVVPTHLLNRALPGGLRSLGGHLLRGSARRWGARAPE